MVNTSNLHIPWVLHGSSNSSSRPRVWWSLTRTIPKLRPFLPSHSPKHKLLAIRPSGPNHPVRCIEVNTYGAPVMDTWWRPRWMDAHTHTHTYIYIYTCITHTYITHQPKTMHLKQTCGSSRQLILQVHRNRRVDL